jgi:hypothetical protein
MSANATLAQIKSYRASVTQALLGQHRRKGYTVQPRPMFTDTRPVERQASSAQLGYLRDLMTRLANHNPAVHTDAKAWIDGFDGQLSSVDASRAIDAVKRHLATPAAVPPAPRPTPTARVAAEVRTLLAELTSSYRYALEVGGEGSNDWRFYRLTETAVGSFRYLQVGHASGDGIAWERLSLPAQLVAARGITRNAHEAMLDFGRHLGRCGHCGRVLTNQASREAGIGPICASK